MKGTSITIGMTSCFCNNSALSWSIFFRSCESCCTCLVCRGTALLVRGCRARGALARRLSVLVLKARSVEGGNPRADQGNEAILSLALIPAPAARAAGPCAPTRWQSLRRRSPGRGYPCSERGHTGEHHPDAGGKTFRGSGHVPGLSSWSVLA